MSLTTAEKKNFKNEMCAGVHLASIFDMKIHRDSNKQPILKDGEMGIIITFVTTKDKTNLYHEQVYWVGKGNEGKEKYLTQMCLDAMIDMSVTPMPKSAALNKRLWIAIREVFTLVNNGEAVKKNEITGKDVIENFIFQTAPIFDVDRIPTWKGDPKFNDGVACDDFVGYKEDNEGEDGYVTIADGKQPEPFVLEVAQVTPEVEQAVAVVIEKKPKKEKKVNPIVKVIDGEPQLLHKPIVEQMKELGEEKELIDRKLNEAVSQTPAPNFGDHPINEMWGKTATPEFKEKTSTPLPNFGDSQTPDTNF